jgi:hypothetical protein
VIWRFGARLFLIVNVQILDDGAVQVIGAPNQAAAHSVAGVIVYMSIFRRQSSDGRAPPSGGSNLNQAFSTHSAECAFGKGGMVDQSRQESRHLHR